MESLAVKYRPIEFEDVIGQDSIVKILKRQLELNQFKNSYLFCGPSGCGKTTLARIFAYKINNGIGCPIEIDAASNNGVDNVKNIVKEANERSIDSKYKIYIIDECHSLTNQAWQAFLKCIEEPPAFTIFIFATTDVQKVPQTILNRCMRFNFNRISSQLIENRLNKICQIEGFTNYKDTTNLISKICKNQCRDAIQLLDTVASYSVDFNIENTKNILGNYSYDIYFNLINFIIDDDEGNVLSLIEDIYNNGFDLQLFVEQFLSFVLDVLKFILFNDISVTNIPINYLNRLNNSINFNDSNKYYCYISDKLLDLKLKLKNDINIKNTILVAILQMCRLV